MALGGRLPVPSRGTGLLHALNAPETEMEAGRPLEVQFPVGSQGLRKAPAGESSVVPLVAPGGLYWALANPSAYLHSSTGSSRDFSHGSVETVDSGPGGMSTPTGHSELDGRKLADGADIDIDGDTSGSLNFYMK